MELLKVKITKDIVYSNQSIEEVKGDYGYVPTLLTFKNDEAIIKNGTECFYGDMPGGKFLKSLNGDILEISNIDDFIEII